MSTVRRQIGRVAPWVVPLVLIVLAVRATWTQQGPPMEEGHMLAFPQRLLAGEKPHVDFLHLYGPASLYVLAGAFKLFGDVLRAERLVGLLQLLGAVAAIAWFARPWGRWVASWLAVVVITLCFWPLGLTAMAWNGAIAWGLLSLVFLRRALISVPTRAIDLPAAGGCAALAVAYRPDLAGAMLLIGMVLVVIHREGAFASRIRLKPLIMGAAPIIAGVLAFVAWVGVGDAWYGMFTEPVFELRAGRSLPVPPSWGTRDGFLQRAEILGNIDWSFPMIQQSHQIFLWFWALVLCCCVPIIVMSIRWRRGARSGQDAALFCASAFALGILPQALQRPDTTHLAWVSYAALPIALLVLVHVLRNTAWPRNTGSIAAAGTVLFLYGVIAPYYPLRGTVEFIQRGFGRKEIVSYQVRRDHRVYYLASPETAADAQQIFDVLDAQSKPGERLFVGPRDLRYTNYSDAYIYGMFPELRPATRFIEMDPGVTNIPSNGLDKEIRSADWVIRSETAATWREPNTSSEPGWERPNEIVEQHFCEVLHTNHFDLMRKC